MARERILGPAQGVTAPPPPALPPGQWRTDRWRDPSARTFHIFQGNGELAVCGVRRRYGWTNLKCDSHKTCRVCLRNRNAAAGAELKSGNPRERIVLKVDREDLAGVDAAVGRLKRKQFIRDAIREKLDREKGCS